MKYIPDRTGRFRERPHYQPNELDVECEGIVHAFMNASCGGFSLPIPTDALTKLIERDARDLDLYADLVADEGEGIEGVTDFCIGKKPCVRIAKELSEYPWCSHRLRTTLTHEYGHVKFHDPLYQTSQGTAGLFVDAFDFKPLQCKRDKMINAPAVDWMEWQAGYVCGAILMPMTHLKRLVSDYMARYELPITPASQSAEAQRLILQVAMTFDVSNDAARIRLLKLGYLTDGYQGEALLR